MRKEDKMTTLCKAFLDSNLSRKAFCELHNLKVHTLNYWQRKLSIRNDHSFLRVKPTPNLLLQADGVFEIELTNGIKIRTESNLEIIRQLAQLT